MPINVPNATATTVLPLSLSKAFSATRDYPVLINTFANGESIREIQATNSRRSWAQTKRLTAAQMTELREFYDARGGGKEPFFFYDPFASDPLFNYDATGASLNGRFTVVFRGDWQQSIGLGRGECSIQLIELSAALSDADVLSFQNSNSSGHLATMGV